MEQKVLTPAETSLILRAVERCMTESDPVLRQLAVVYLRGMCAVLRIQGKLDACQSVLSVVDREQ